MAEPKTMIGFRVSESFKTRIEAERIKRGLSVQEMIHDALLLYFQTPKEEWDRGITTYYLDDPSLSKREADKLHARAELWQTYLDSMPEKKIELMADTMKLDLLHYKSSRRKGGRRG